eukprot:scaffold94383_cov35-Prasinocladus_malaysianus.AAC.1
MVCRTYIQHNILRLQPGKTRVFSQPILATLGVRATGDGRSLRCGCRVLNETADTTCPSSL